MKSKIMVLIGAILFFIPITVGAETSNQPYTVKPVFPSNQDKDVMNYISITTKESSLKQEVEFDVTNNKKKPITVNIKPLNALTSPQGSIQYVKEDKQENSKIVEDNYVFKDYVKIDKEVTLEGQETKRVTLEMDIDNIKGTLLGSVGFQIKEDDKGEDKQDGKFTIKNEINNIIGVSVNFPTKETFDLKIGDVYLDPMPSYYAIRLPVTHDKPLITKNVNLIYEVKDKHGDTLFKSPKGLVQDFAPQTEVNISIPYESEDIVKNEEYTIKGKFVKGNKVVPFEKNFKYTSDGDVENRGKTLTTPYIKGNWLNLLWLLPLLLIPILYYIFRNKYAYLLNEPMSPMEIYEDDTEVSGIKQINKVTKRDKQFNNFMHVYKKTKDENGNKVYTYIKTKETRRKQ